MSSGAAARVAPVTARRTEIQGHRGARALRPENTLPGLACALAIGVDALEFDVTLTADGGLMHTVGSRLKSGWQDKMAGTR